MKRKRNRWIKRIKKRKWRIKRKIVKMRIKVLMIILLKRWMNKKVKINNKNPNQQRPISSNTNNSANEPKCSKRCPTPHPSTTH